MTRDPGLALLATVVFSVTSAAAELPGRRTEVREIAPGESVQIHLRAGNLKIVQGSDPKHVLLRYTAEKHHQDAADLVRLRFEAYGSEARINLTAPHDVNVDAVVEVPSPVSLRVRMLAGDLTVEGIQGNKDLEDHFGDMTLNLGPQLNYRRIDASVRIGDIDGFPSGQVHGWLGKSGTFDGKGEYRLHAHVGAGDIRFSTK